MNTIIIFIGLSIINVVFSTIRSIVTIKGGKLSASLFNGGYFAFYNIMLIYTVMDFPMLQKCIITFACNVIGVYLVKLFEEKPRKDKLWKVEMTINTSDLNSIIYDLKEKNLSFNYIQGIGNYTIVNIFCLTQFESATAKAVMKKYNAKYFVSESKVL